MPKVDLHTHSDFSDGTCSPEEVVRAALKSGAGVYALTDHDTTDGVRRAEAVCREHRILFTPGVEISTREHDHLHFTGYNLNLNDKAFQDFLAQNRQNRRERIRQIIRQLAQAGVDPRRVWQNGEAIVRAVLEDPCCESNPMSVEAFLVRRILEEVTGRV